MRSTLILLHLLLLLFSIGFHGCSEREEVSDAKEYLDWINDPVNGLIQTKYINDLKVSIKYLPADYLAFLEIKGRKLPGSAHVRDSLISFYAYSETFILTVGPDDRKRNTSEPGNDIMFKDVNNMEEYRTRSLAMNFDMGEYVSLMKGEEKLKPVISNMENVYGLSPDRNIHFVFTPKQDGTQDDLDFVFNDEIFNTGITHFVFTKDQLNKIPKLIF